MSQPTVSEFLREKMTNMAKWVEGELGHTEVDLPLFVESRTNAELVFLAECIKEANPSTFEEIASIPNTPPAFKSLVGLVEKRSYMHEKFWRYVDLFVQTISN